MTFHFLSKKKKKKKYDTPFIWGRGTRFNDWHCMARECEFHVLYIIDKIGVLCMLLRYGKRSGKEPLSIGQSSISIFFIH